MELLGRDNDSGAGENFGSPMDGDDGGFGGGSASQNTSPLVLILTRMHGRWGYAIALAALLAPLFAATGFLLGPVEYTSRARLQVVQDIDPLVADTIETQGIDATSMLADQAALMRSDQVIMRAISKLGKYELEVPSYRQSVGSQLQIITPRNSTILEVALEHANREFASDAVNAVADAFIELHAPDSEIEFQKKVETINSRIDASRRRIRELRTQEIDILKDSEYAITSVATIMDQNYEGMRRIKARIEEQQKTADRIREMVTVRASQIAAAEGREATEAERTPQIDDRIDPTMRDLSEFDPELPGLESRLARDEVEFSLVKQRFGPRHEQYRRYAASLEVRSASFDERMELARKAWETGAGQDRSWGSIQARLETLRMEQDSLRAKNDALLDASIRSEEIRAKITGENGELSLLENRRQDLDRERDLIRKGRVEFPARAVPAPFASKDKRFQAAMFGGVAGLGISFGFFFLLGSIDQKTYGVSQLERESGSSLKVLGVLPNMDEVSEDAESITLATDCIHRLRGKIEARRAPEKGYALMVSSPFQGDGKTTLAVSLGWSYAESGYKTLLLDADFIGRAMTHQFGRLRDPGLREIIRNGRVQDEIAVVGHENLSLLGVGFDRRISAANLSPRLMSRVLESVRESFDIIIIDSGPITASIEAMPVAGASDGAILALRRGRSRARLTECMKDIRSVGADYLGVVFNYADRSDCMRYGSTSRMSQEVHAALEGNESESLPSGRNPLLGDLDHGRPDA